MHQGLWCQGYMAAAARSCVRTLPAVGSLVHRWQQVLAKAALFPVFHL
jgi:hypothetical protein